MHAAMQLTSGIWVVNLRAQRAQQRTKKLAFSGSLSLQWAPALIRVDLFAKAKGRPGAEAPSLGRCRRQAPDYHAGGRSPAEMRWRGVAPEARTLTDRTGVPWGDSPGDLSQTLRLVATTVVKLLV
jgi:hypothetical protein